MYLFIYILGSIHAWQLDARIHFYGFVLNAYKTNVSSLLINYRVTKYDSGPDLD